MERRIELHEKLCEILGSKHVYFQPPESVKMVYPSIVYNKSDMRLRYADNDLYNYMNQYSIIVIDKNPDSEIHLNILKSFPYCSYDRFYTSDNLNHHSLTLYF